MLSRSSRSRNFFRKIVVNGVNNSSKAAVQNDCLMRLYDADAELKAISNELDSFDGKKDPIRCNFLVNQLRTAQDKVISLLFQLMDECNCERASRDYRMKFPDEILLSEGSESLNGQIWFGAECLSAGSNILNHTKESTMLRPMAKTLTQHLDSLRNDLRDLVIDGSGASHINQALIKKMVNFDHIFATFEYEYVRTMLPIRTVAEIEKLQEVAVLFSETLIDCVRRGLIKQEDIDEFQPIVMIAIPRLAIVRGLLYKNENPIYNRHKSQMCSIFQPFHGPLHSIRKLLRGLSSQELLALERMLADDQSELCSSKQATNSKSPSAGSLTSQQLQRQQTESIQNVSSAEDSGINSNVIERQQSSDIDADAGTSNNFPNLLMNGLQYPVGHKRDSTDETSSSVDNQHRYHTSSQSLNDLNQQDCLECCAFDVPSSSKQHESSGRVLESHATPIGSAPSTSSSVASSTNDSKRPGKRCHSRAPVTGTDPSQSELTEGSIKSNDGDHCCMSPPESDAQLEKLIAKFDSTMAPQQGEPNVVSKEGSAEPLVSLPSTTKKDKKGHMKDSSEITDEEKQQLRSATNSSKDEELLEEFFIKQAQQLLHRLFVAISGVADQLQSNFASDLRFILRHIFSSELEDRQDDEATSDDDYDETADVDNANPDDYSTNDNSDNSLPIEQAIEAQEEEVSNLIDLDSGCSPNENPCDGQDQEMCPTTPSNENGNRYCPYYRVASATSLDSADQSSTVALMTTSAHQAVIYEDEPPGQHRNSSLEGDHYRQPTMEDESAIFRSSTSTRNHHQDDYRQPSRNVAATNNLSSDRRLVYGDSLERPQQVLHGETISDYIRATQHQQQHQRNVAVVFDPTESLNDPSSLDGHNQNRQQFIQQHLQNISRLHRSSSSRSSVRSSLAQQPVHRYDGSRQQHSSQQPISGALPEHRLSRSITYDSSHPTRQQQQHQANHPYLPTSNQQHAVTQSRRSSRHHGSSSRSRRTRGPPVWVPDELVVACNCCNATFTLFRRRHHCRACGQIFCADCSKFTKDLNCWGYNGPVRVCQSCYQQPI